MSYSDDYVSVDLAITFVILDTLNIFLIDWLIDWLSGNQAAVDRVRHIAVEDLVVSQEDKPKRHRSACEILQETAILLSSVHRIVHRDLQLKCFK